MMVAIVLIRVQIIKSKKLINNSTSRDLIDKS